MQPSRKLNWSKQPSKSAADSDSDEEGESRSAALSAKSKRSGTVTAKGSLLTKPSKKQRKGGA